ncbi:tetraacyldisaccharide 4'-kinase [Patiriisocius marinistellae]|uniref:Tetraacyldisaccharide 4'-kinase n=1 Tax=Patiriisocius marinistellae TaxID=2494560 RepID=A0A5J4FYJ6_9FLAO|nr:tetraacyldisaccharide 4'-kinase [Patiriisocius marinistellae]GEQ87123.1 tetraacyldisaccharide 4'-kinase [Patiriisocius marinistellae]
MKTLRKILFPFAVLYGWITRARNVFYNKGWFKSKQYRLPVICVGNLSVGGTGKSPMIELLIEILKEDYKVATLSRGYKRKTKGFLEVKTTHTVAEVGDEPLQFKQKFPEVTVAVCADRRTGIEVLEKEAQVILLDDAFQHRKVKASLNIMLTPCDELYVQDFLLPTGNLRESRTGADRADIIVVTKCKKNIAYAKMQEIRFILDIKEHQKLYFTTIDYADSIFGISEVQPLHYLIDKPFTLVTGIANPKPLVDFLIGEGYQFEHKKYPDHHNFSEAEINALKKEQIILTTEKDFMRLKSPLGKYALYYLPIKTKVLNGQESFFKEMIFKNVEANLFS